MLRKLSFIFIIAILLTACGASAPSDNAMEETAPVSVVADSTALVEDMESAETAAGEGPFTRAEYFRITKYSNAITNDDGVTLVYENYAQAEFVSQDPARTEWVNGMLGGIRRDFQVDSSNLYTYAADFVAEWGTEGFYSYSNYQQLGVARHDDAVASLISLSSLYSGGSHPNAVQTAYNLDIDEQRLLTLEDVILESAAPELAKLVRAGVDEKFTMIDGGNGLFEDYADTIDNSMLYGNMTPYWYLNDRGLVIFYNQYELGPYAAGIIKVELPYESLTDILTAEFLPVVEETVLGDMLLRGEWEGRNSIPILIEPEGEIIRVGVEGVVRQVQLSEILWLGETPVAQDLLFSAKIMGQNDVLEITGGFDDEDRSFAIEFTNGRGERVLYYIHPGELSAEP